MKISTQRLATFLLGFIFAVSPVSQLSAQDVPAKQLQTNRGVAERQVNAVWVNSALATGGTSKVSIRVFPNYSKTASVGVMEEFYNGTGETWKTAAWIAAINAARVNNSTIVDHEFLVKVGGQIDGPSAGMLTSVAMLASIRGDKLRTDTTMTGTINPDGTSGVVGGIPQKMEGAAKAGITRFGYPVGTRTSFDLKTRQKVDVNAHAFDLGMEAKEIRDIYEAYEFLTGIRLKRPVAVNDSDMNLSISLRTRVEGWALRAENQLKQRLEDIIDKANANPLVNQMLKSTIADMQTKFDDAQAFRRGSLPVAAYYRMMECDSIARALDAMIDVIPAFQTRELSKLQGHLKSVQQKALSRLKAFQLQARGSLMNQRLGGRIDAINSMNQCAQSAAYLVAADEAQFEFTQLVKLFSKAETVEQQQAYVPGLTLKFVFACLHYEMAGVAAEYAEDWLSVDSTMGEKVQVSAEKLEALGRAYASAGSSCLSYFDALVVKKLAQGSGLSMAQARAKFSMVDTRYPIAMAFSFQTKQEFKYFPTRNRMENALFRLGSGLETYLVSAGMANQYYSLNDQSRADQAAKLENRKLTGVMLQRARKWALEEAGDLQAKQGFVPDSVRVNFQYADALREGNDEDKLNALYAYWRAAYLCDLAVSMTQKESASVEVTK